MLSKMLYSISVLIFGTLYPTYLSFKALKQKDDTECARMMMYWIVFAIFTFLEGFLDIFVGIWFPFYFESKIIFLFWLISPYGNGAKVLYENFVHQKIEQHEQVIDDFISSMKHISIDLFWKAWGKCSVYANYILIQLFTKAQIAFIQYMNNRNDSPLSLHMQNPFASLSFATGGDSLASNASEQQPQVLAKQIEETIKDETNALYETEQNAVINTDSMITDDDEAIEMKKPGRKTKRKRRVAADISDKSNATNARVTRSKALKSESQSASDVDML